MDESHNTIQTSEEILKQVNEEHSAYLRNTPVAANAFEATFSEQARSGLLEELIEGVLTDGLDEAMQNYDHRLTGERLADFLELAGRKIKDIASHASNGVEVMAKNIQPEIVSQVKLLTLQQQANV